MSEDKLDESTVSVNFSARNDGTGTTGCTKGKDVLPETTHNSLSQWTVSVQN